MQICPIKLIALKSLMSTTEYLVVAFKQHLFALLPRSFFTLLRRSSQTCFFHLNNGPYQPKARKGKQNNSGFLKASAHADLILQGNYDGMKQNMDQK